MNSDVNAHTKQFFDKLFINPSVKESEVLWKSKWKSEVIDSLLSLKKNFPPKNGEYKSRDARRFVEYGIPEYLVSRYPNILQLINHDGKMFFIDSFPSVKMNFYSVFYRFYLEKRTPEDQDIFDILINSCVPYVDTVFTEAFQAEIINKIKTIDNFLAKIRVRTIKDLRNGSATIA